MTDKNTESTQINNGTLNQLRAAVLGANDGIVSTASVVMGVAGATDSKPAIITAGLAALVAGALSMAVGEYVSVSSQSDAEKAYIEKERAELENDPDGELDELTQAYIDEGVSPATARKVAEELTEKDAMKAHLRIEFNLDEQDISSPTQAAIASLLSFTVGGLVPFLAVVFAPNELRIWVTSVAVLIALVATGYLSASVGGASRLRAVLRVVIGGLIAMGVTYLIGHLFGTSIG
jgi:vacuolar iron transporter family protein